MPMSADHTLFGRVLDWIKARAVRDNELGSMSRADLQFLASDIGVSEADLRAVGPLAADHTELVDQMLRARGLDPLAVRIAFRGAFRDLEVTCARCRESGTCRRELTAGTAGAHAHEFCPNIGLMDEFLAAKA